MVPPPQPRAQSALRLLVGRREHLDRFRLPWRDASEGRRRHVGQPGQRLTIAVDAHSDMTAGLDDAPILIEEHEVAVPAHQLGDGVRRDCGPAAHS